MLHIKSKIYVHIYISKPTIYDKLVAVLIKLK